MKRRNIIFECAKFNLRKQEEGEPIDSFITDLYSLTEHCQYGTLHDEMIRDRLVVGLYDSKRSEKLQLDAKLTLDTALTTARQSEAVKKQQLIIRQETIIKEESIGAVSRGGKIQTRGRGKQFEQTTTCFRCGKSPMHDRLHCPAKEAICHKCGKRGHFQSACRSVPSISAVYKEPPRSEEDIFLGNVQENTDDTWNVDVQLNGNSALIPEQKLL